MGAPHLSVLLKEVVAAFEGMCITTFVDGTLGAGGHATALLQAHPEITQYIGIDQDPTALAIASARLELWKDQCRFVHANFSDIATVLAERQVASCDGILLDLGVSSMQLDTAERGFSINNPGPLDMRMNPNRTLTAAEIVNTWSERELAYLFRNYGEEKRWRQAASAIAKARQHQPLTTTQELVNLLYPILKDPRSSKGIHPLTLVFQALRIAVNEELDVLESTLKHAIDLLSPGGRLAVISFHSLEDRIVKQCFAYFASDKESTRGIAGVFKDKQPLLKMITRKPAMPSTEECAINPRARSARLRVVEKVGIEPQT